MTDLDTIFRNDVILRYPWPVTPAQVTHAYSSVRNNSRGEPYDFERIETLLSSLRWDVEKRYCQQTGKEKMDTYSLGDKIDAVRAQFWHDVRFKEAFKLLELDWEKDHAKATIPWWNEIATGEICHQIEQAGSKIGIRSVSSHLDEENESYSHIRSISSHPQERYPRSCVRLLFGPRHSLETQLMREGVFRPIQNVSVGGIIVTRPEKGFGVGNIVFGLRGGASYPNTYHINAGALKATPEFKNGSKTIYDQFKEQELLPEFGITDKDIVSARLGSRIYDHIIDKGPMYVFVVETNLTRAELYERWEKNLDPDKKEHDAPIDLRNTRSAIDGFINSYYRGKVANKATRTNDERYLLHPGALALASYSNMPVSELRTLFRYVHS